MAETNLTEFPRGRDVAPANDAAGDPADAMRDPATARAVDAGKPSPRYADPAGAEPAADRPNSIAVGVARVLWMALLTGAVLFAGYYGEQRLIAAQEEPRKRPAREKVSFVNTVPVAFGTYQPTLQLFGETTAGRRVEMRALVAGDVQSVGAGLRDGGEVKRGDVLLTINPFDYEGAVVETTAELAAARGRLDELKAALKSERDALERDREQLAIAEKDVRKTRALVQRNAVSERLLDERTLTRSQRQQATEQRENAINVQTARITQQEATIERLEWSLRQAKKKLADTKLIAPFDAYVSDVNADVGRLLGASDRVATLLDEDWIEARFVLTNAQYGRLVGAAREDGMQLIGMPVTVIWRVGDAPLRYAAKITRIGATIAAGQGGVTMIARIDTPTEPVPLRPGAFVEVELADRRYANVVRLPQTSLYDGNTVYVVEENRLAPRKVTLVGTDGAFVLVQSDGLSDGASVITTRLSNVGEGIKVEVL
ncbi:MAG: efflux RND transporter periplasmic adaptor subunit [Pseudomonadota bacterium]